MSSDIDFELDFANWEEDQEQRVPSPDGFVGDEFIILPNDEFIDESDDEPESIDYSRTTYEQCFFTANGWTETRTKRKLKCITVFGKRICTHLDELQSRSCKKKFYVMLFHPDIDASLNQALNDAIRNGAVAAIPILIATSGNVSAAATAFKYGFVETAKERGITFASKIRIALETRSKCGSWKRVT